MGYVGEFGDEPSEEVGGPDRQRDVAETDRVAMPLTKRATSHRSANWSHEPLFVEPVDGGFRLMGRGEAVTDPSEHG